jgi:hypothetical protein
MTQCANNFLNSLSSIPVWMIKGNFIVCIDQRTNKELQRVPYPVDNNGKKIQIFEGFFAYTTKDLIIDVRHCSTDIYKLTKPTKPRTTIKRLLPKNSYVQFQLFPHGRFELIGGPIFIGDTQQDSFLSINDLTFSNPTTVPSVKPNTVI